MLFPDIYNGFKERVSTKSLTYTCIDTVQDKDMPSKRWLLARLHKFFDNMLIVECRHRRHGSLVYLEGCDHLTVISSLLGQNPPTESTVVCDSTPLPEPNNDHICFRCYRHFHSILVKQEQAHVKPCTCSQMKIDHISLLQTTKFIQNQISIFKSQRMVQHVSA